MFYCCPIYVKVVTPCLLDHSQFCQTRVQAFCLSLPQMESKWTTSLCFCGGCLSLRPKSSQWPSIMMSLLFGQTSLPSPLTLWQRMFGNHNQIIRNYIVPLDYYSEKWELNLVMWRWTENLTQLSWTDLEQRKVLFSVLSIILWFVIVEVQTNSSRYCGHWSQGNVFIQSLLLWT